MVNRLVPTALGPSVAGLILVALGLALWWPPSASPSRRSDLGTALLGGAVVAFAVAWFEVVVARRSEQDKRHRQEAAERQNLQLTVGLQQELRGIGLAGRDLSGFYLRGKDLSETDLIGANLSGAFLAKANLFGTFLAEGNLTGVNLSQASVRRPSSGRPTSPEPTSPEPIS